MWIFMLISLITSCVVQFISTGFTTATILIIIPTIVTLIKVLYENLDKFRVFYRRTINILNLSTFDIDFTAVFKIVNESKINNINKDYLKIQSIIYELLSTSGFKGSKNELIEISFDRISGVKMYVRPYKIYLSLSQTDNMGEINLTIRASAALKYRNANEIIENFLVSFYRHLCEKELVNEIKYIVKINKNTKKGNFMANHFIKEIKPDDIKNFEVNMKHNKNGILNINNKCINFITSERSDLINSIKKAVELIN